MNAGPSEKILWSKAWKQDGSVKEVRKTLGNNTVLSQSSNVYKWLDKLHYRYIPAIKGPVYFSTLMGILHDALNEAHTKVLKRQGSTFISGIQNITESITKELDEQIGIKNSIQVPSDFKQLFSNLDFGEYIDGNTYHLKRRGDGIKAWHIPVILHYIAGIEKSVTIPGYVKPDTIWGFEEPENNLEMGYSFKMAETFLEYSKQLQIFTTSHSPAFYSLDAEKCNRYYISQDADNNTRLENIKSKPIEELHTQMGMLPLVTDYIEEIYRNKKELDELRRKVDEISDSKKVIVLTEDRDHQHLKVLFEANGFRIEDIDFISYECSSNFKEAVFLGKYKKKKNPDMMIVIHRDRDYLDDAEIESLKRITNAVEINLFITDGVDVESHFIDSDHLIELFPQLEPDKINAIIKDATDEAREDSIDRLIDHTMKKGTPAKGGYAKCIKSLLEKYAENEVRYRYGKKVFGLMKSKIQQEIKVNPNIIKCSQSLKNTVLINLVSKYNEI